MFKLHQRLELGSQLWNIKGSLILEVQASSKTGAEV